ncbi:MAG: hypothetical protein JST89_17030 [Cyanobacteria bacterium SZAS-4]|nr:hypothetical protein [Cyanobacteria bacterium SZAS-4]
MKVLQRWISLTMLLSISSFSSPPHAFCLDKETERMIHDAMEQPPTPTQVVSEFISHSAAPGSPKPDMVTTSDGQIYVRLITPLNSSFNMSGDVVKAVVVGSSNKHGKPWLQEGAILEGRVEDAKKATYAQTDGSLVVRFYDLVLDNHHIELFTTPDTDDHTLKPSPVHLTTKKQRVRGILMTVTKIAIPAAIGTGGMSIAITAGAGAAIGLAFSDKGKRIKGTVRGAWEGAGLNALDPLVCKGNSVILPEGTPLQLQLSEPVTAPKYVANSNEQQITADVAASLSAGASSVTQLATHAQIVKNSSTSAAVTSTSETDAKIDPLLSVNKKIAQNDLAGAITALTEAERLYPQDENVKNMRKRIFEIVSGQKSSDNNRSSIY